MGMKSRERSAGEGRGAGDALGVTCAHGPAPCTPAWALCVCRVAGLKSLLQPPRSAGGGSLRCQGCCSSPVFQVPTVSPSLHSHCWIQSMRFNLLPPASDPPRPSQSPLTCLSHILFSLFRFCFFVSEFSHFAYNFCPSYFLPVPRNTISLPPAPSLSFISRLLSVLLPPCPLD